MANEGFWYLASPYSKHPKGPQFAFEEISRQAGLLLKNKIFIYCPIAHSHPICQYSDMGLDDYNLWLPADKAIFQYAKGLIVCMLDSWQNSYGVNWEIEEFAQMDKPVIFMTPGIVPKVLMND